MGRQRSSGPSGRGASTAVACRRPTTTCCGTTASAARGACRLVGPRVADRDPHQDVGRVGLRVVDLDDPVAVVVEDAGVEQLVLGLELRARARSRAIRSSYGNARLRVVVAPAQPGAARQRVEVPPVLLGVLAVVALAVRQPEHPLLEDRVAAVPQRQRRGTAGRTRRTARPSRPRSSGRPASGRGRAGRGPRVAVGAVVLAHRAPGPLGQVRTPLVPRAGARRSPPRGGRGRPSARARIERRRRGVVTGRPPGRRQTGRRGPRRSAGPTR